MNSETILHQIKNNQLSGHEQDFVVAQLCVMNNKPYLEMQQQVQALKDNHFIKIENQIVTVVANEPTENYFSDKFVHRNRHAKTQKHTFWEGKIQGTKSNYSFFIPFDGEQDDVFIKNENLFGALHGDTVSIEVFKTKRGLEGRVVQIIERGNDRIVGKISLGKKFAFVVCDDVKFGKDIFVPMNKIMNAKDGEKVVVKIVRYAQDNKNPEGEIVEVLGMPNHIETEVLSIIRSYNLYEQFPNKVLEEAAKMPTELKPDQLPKNRLDLTKDLIFTIDGEDARDLDDAISLTTDENNNRVLGVHIADVGEYVKIHGILDNEAFKRATSVYFPNLVLPMLPKALSNGICSLNEMVERLTLSVFITYDQNAKVLKYNMAESFIKSKKRYTYTEVQKVLDGDAETVKRNAPFVSTLRAMNELAKQLLAQRTKRGAIDFDIPEVKIELNDTGDVLTVRPQDRDDSHRLIESFMIAANEVVAKHFNSLKLPFVYRIHEQPDSEKMVAFSNFIKQFGIVNAFDPGRVKPKDLQKVMEQISDSDVKYVVNRICLRSLKKAKYDPNCTGHFGLASTYYCHFTSPIRRYPDLTIHRILKDYLHQTLTGDKLADTKHFVGASSQTSSEREVIAEKAERDVDDLYKTFYMSHHLMEEFEGRINSVTAYGVYVELDNTVEGLLRTEDLPADRYKFDDVLHKLTGTQNHYAIGQKVKVKAIRADILAREIDFILA